MKITLIFTLLLLAFLIVLRFSQAAGRMLEEGAEAPDFPLKDQAGKGHTLEQYRGHWLVLYFYPKDDTPGCTKEACGFRDGYRELSALGVKVIGVSLDDALSHAQFAEKYRLPFPLLADTQAEVARNYGVLWKLGPIRFAKRQTFIIDPRGRIAKRYRNVDAATHAERVIADLKPLLAAREAAVVGP